MPPCADLPALGTGGMSVRARAGSWLLCIALAAFGSLPAMGAPPRAASGIGDIPYEAFSLPNGLEVIVHTDRTAPLVAVHVSYKVGSRDEPPGRSGFAHLFEHLMFKRTVHHPVDHATPLAAAGAVDVDGRTGPDRTFYTQTVPTPALDLALWLESERMGHLAPALDATVVEQQRGVVRNEKRQGQNRPYGQVRELLVSSLYPPGHPYHHGVIGSIADIDAATIDELRAWFRAWYGPNNAVLVLAGDIDLPTAREKALHYFGDIPPGPRVERTTVAGDGARMHTRSTHEDRVARPRIHAAWSVAPGGSAGFDLLQVAGQILGRGRSARLARRLQHDERLVDAISLSLWSGQLASRLWVTADVAGGVDVAAVEAAIQGEIDRFIAEGPSEGEVRRAVAGLRAAFARNTERLGGVGGRADVLGACAAVLDDPGCSRVTFERLANATAEDVRLAAARWLAQGHHTLTILPGTRVELPEAASPPSATIAVGPPDPGHAAVPTGLDRSVGPPATGRFAVPSTPPLKRARLSNGTRVILAERPDAPLVRVSYEFPAGFRTDGDLPGISAFTFNMLDEGAGGMDALAFAGEAEALGIEVGVASGLDANAAYVSTLPGHLSPALGLLADMLRRPRFDPDAIEGLRQAWLASIRQETGRPEGIAFRVLAPRLYGSSHPYAASFTGLGDEQAIATLTRRDLLDYHAAWIRPEDATIVAAGAVAIDDLVGLLEAHFGDWHGSGVPGRVPDVSMPTPPASPQVVFIRQPGAVQATIFAAQLVPPASHPDSPAFDAADAAFSATFGSRLNTALRERKGWSYGTYSRVPDASGPRPWILVAPVEAAQAGEALAEIRRQLAAYFGGDAPVTQAEIDTFRRHEERSLPGRLDSVRSLVSEIGAMVRHARPEDHAAQRMARIAALDPREVDRVASVIRPDALAWVVVGNDEAIEAASRVLDPAGATRLEP